MESTLESKGNLNWQTYWSQGDFWTYPELFEVNAELFVKQATPYLSFNQTDKVLNIGCGPGFLERLLSPRVASMTSVDISKPFVELCAEQTKDLPNIETLSLGSDYTNLAHCGQGFSKILCISVLQYYQSISEVEALLQSVREISISGSKMLIADMPRRRNKMGELADAAGAITGSLKGGYFSRLASKMIREHKKIRTYRAAAKNINHLFLSEHDFIQIAKRMNLRAEVIKKPFSICPNRLSFLIHF